ncbi:Hypothetical protein DEACI_2653 [Acididesulfobacillus acetoxydans]|uniref:Uncharacterized protein n=1 Tax=Acididesulfobacillus acetoxydans TaxID=1561005 RepID=A0A8S0WGL2_9FIRM|nr:Hypothetical protein DEACI_2653 [Acididesulfobacillus acetoxydans]CEJ08174.1 Hypothetical protein DEACI_2649 [Acididesulfobacillus acetoxydans]
MLEWIVALMIGIFVISWVAVVTTSLYQIIKVPLSHLHLGHLKWISSSTIK